MRLTTSILTAAAACVLALSLTGCQLATGIVNGAVDKARQLELSENQTPGGPAQPADSSALTATLIRVVDGDTITVVPDANFPATNDSGSEHTIRMLGIDTPELNKMSGAAPECGAEEATHHLGDLLRANARNVQLTVVFDARADHTDRFGRSLAYIELATSGTHRTDVAQAMVAAGFAEAWYPWGEPEPERFPGYDDAQQAAVAANAGLYASCDTIGR